MNNVSDICERIKEVRVNAGLKPAEFGDRLGEKLSRVQDIERCKQRPPADVLGKITEIFHVDGTWLLTGAGKMRGNVVREEVLPYGSEPEDRLRHVTEQVLAVAGERKVKPDPMQLGPLRDFAYLASLSDQRIHALFDLLEDAPKVYGYKQFNDGD